ncbi:hypothetical protein FRB94_014604 [Tulasnella sp. JGI-2019a]|nr:hypothetical protein FRB94_014604 [Tulasnella sp. JGI-2019a]KAG9036719.1 hypothetical protein FRB95_008050 [Tulasnella sp. JGI-2019a]
MSELLAIGQTCSHPSCSLVDFLPIKCQHCAQPYCSDHWKPQLHSCPKFDAAAHNRVAPACPFCQVPVAFAPGVDPNLAMEEHFANKCEVVRGGSLVGVKGSGMRKNESPRCARKTCKKVLIAPITCQTCYQQFCPEHRFPASHTCKVDSTSTSSLPVQSSSRSAPAQAFVNARASAAAAAMNRAAASMKAGSASTQPNASSSSSSPSKAKSPKPAAASASSASAPSLVNPFSKTERWDPSSKSSVDSAAHSHSIASSFTSISISSSSNDSASSSTSTHQSASSSTTDETTPNPGTTQLSKPPAIIPQSFIPRSIFGTA